MLIYKFEIPEVLGVGRDGMSPSGPLTRFEPPPLSPTEVVGRTIDDLVPYLGTYGMGGPGFFGFRLDTQWLVVAIWGAGDWMFADDRLVTDAFHEERGRPVPWIGEHGDELSPKVVGTTIRSLRVERWSFELVTGDGVRFAITESAEGRPILEGSKEPRAFTEEDDLRKVVFLSPTDEIWV